MRKSDADVVRDALRECERRADARGRFILALSFRDLADTIDDEAARTMRRLIR